MRTAFGRKATGETHDHADTGVVGSGPITGSAVEIRRRVARLSWRPRQGMMIVLTRRSMRGAARTLDLVPIRWGDRWMDDGSDLELWTEDKKAGLRLQVTPAGELFGSRADGPRYPNARITIDPSTHDLIVDDPQGVIGPPVDLGWLRRRLDPELCAAIAERADRKRRGDRHGWKDGDRPRVSLGDRVRFCDVFPSSWDVLVIHKGRQYVLIDRYCIAEDADQVPISVEVIDRSRRIDLRVALVRLLARCSLLAARCSCTPRRRGQTDDARADKAVN